jgi:O-antigen/teichoic acid export membrane protein
MAAEIMMGIYFNLSFWYKLTDKTIWGAWFSGIGCAVLIAVNVIFVPHYGYMACAWGGVAGYGTAMLLSYFVGQKKYPIAYPLKSIFIYILMATLFTAIMYALPKNWPMLVRLAINSVIILLYVGHVVFHEFPLSSLPLIGKYLKKR